jgi:hypothetical protein
MDTNTLREYLKQAIAGYVKPAYNGYTFLTTDTQETRFVVTGIGQTRSGRVVNAAIIVQLVGDKIIIERDINSKPLVDDLLAIGVPRDQIILAYIGENAPEMVV